MEYQHRYVCYAKSNGKTPQEMLAHDMATGSGMLGFMTWINKKWNEWAKINNAPRHGISEASHENFDKFIGARNEF